MTHKWKRRHGAINVQIDDFYHYLPTYHICGKCGLRKGYIKNLSHFPILIYFKRPVGMSYDKVISKERIPYKCNSNSSLDQMGFLTMDDLEGIDGNQIEFLTIDEMVI